MLPYGMTCANGIPPRPSLVLAAVVMMTCAEAMAADPSTGATLAGGKIVYEQHCAACHGQTGLGDGPAAVWLYPKPRNFSSGLFKIKSTPGTSLPNDEDLFRTVTRGMPGSSMPSFTYLSETDRRAAVLYVKSITTSTNADGKRVNLFDQASANNELLPPIEVPPEPPITLQSLVEGQTLYAKLGCVVCHGETGEGTGPSAPLLKDVWGFLLPPRDFNNGAFRGGHTGRDLYLRTATGLPGTPMPPFSDEVVKPQERWALVHYIQSLRRKDIEVSDILQPSDGSIHVQKVMKLVTDPSDPAWERMDPVRVPLNPLWPERDPIPAVSVRAVHNGRQIAILCTWRDNIADGAPIRVQDFQDAIALQFSLNGTTPFLGMGDAKNPVNIWQWKAGWQQESDGERQDVNTIYASMHTDIYFQTNALYRTAEAAGNLLSQSHTSPIEDANARGFGTMKSQPASGQNVKGRGVWRDAHWNVLFMRQLKSPDADDVKFVAREKVPVAFAIWDGQDRDRNGRKVISNWYQLILE